MSDQETLDRAVADAKSELDAARQAAKSLADRLVAAIVEQLVAAYPAVARTVVTSNLSRTEAIGNDGVAKLRADVAGIDLEVAARTAFLDSGPLTEQDRPKSLSQFEVHSFEFAPGATSYTVQRVWDAAFEPLRDLLRKTGYQVIGRHPELPKAPAKVVAAAKPYLVANNRLVNAWRAFDEADKAARKSRAASAWDD